MTGPERARLTGAERGDLDLVPQAWHKPRAANGASGASVLLRDTPCLPGWFLLKFPATLPRLLNRVGPTQQGRFPLLPVFRQLPRCLLGVTKVQEASWEGVSPSNVELHTGEEAGREGWRGFKCVAGFACSQFRSDTAELFLLTAGNIQCSQDCCSPARSPGCS